MPSNGCYAQRTLFSATRERHGWPWGEKARARLRADGVVPVDLDRRGRRDTALAVRMQVGWNVRRRFEPSESQAEIQVFESLGYPLLSLVVQLDAPGGSSRIAVGLIFDYGCHTERERFERLSRQSELAVFLVDAEEATLGRMDVPLSLWNRVQVYQALESAARIWRRTGTRRWGFSVARSRWEAVNAAALGVPLRRIAKE